MSSSVRSGGGLGVAIAPSLIILISSLFLGACFNPSYEAPRCSPLGECPSGLTCVAEVCVKDPSIGAGDPDAGPGADASNPPVDAPPMIDAPPPTSTVPSCAPSRRTCGTTGMEDCCAALPVPAGTFGRGHDLAADNRYPMPGSPATISAFRLDRFEVTVGRFRAFVVAMKGTQADPPAVGSGAHDNIANSGWQASWTSNLAANTSALITSLAACPRSTWTGMAGANENRPINCVNWYTAMAFCIWDGGYLPTEAERHYVASGGDQQRAFPWSSPGSSLTIDQTYASYNCMGDGVGSCSVADLLPVGTVLNGVGRWGHRDLGGNVSEWAMDTPVAPYPAPCADCMGPIDTNASFMGGGYADSGPEISLRSAYRVQTVRTNRLDHIGIRCARPPL